MIDFLIEQLTPKFLIRDRTARAMAKGIEAALNHLCDTIETGVSNVTDVDEMPEWRLDEMAWETNCLYDYGASVENKRIWIRDALPMYRAYGTPSAITYYLSNIYDSVEVEEAALHGGAPFHFRVTVSGAWTSQSEAWARKAIARAKNVRSVLDWLCPGSVTRITERGEGKALGRVYYPMTGDAVCGMEEG